MINRGSDWIMENRKVEKTSSGVGREGLLDGEYAIEDLVDLDKLKMIFEKFSSSTGYAVGFIAHPSARVLIASGWSEACLTYHRASPESEKHCKSSYQCLTDQVENPQQVNIHFCENGLVDGATPVFLNGHHIASLMIGQVFFEKPDMERFKIQAEEYGYDVANYLKAIRRISVVSEDDFRGALSFLSEVASIIAEQGLSQLGFMERAAELEREVQDRRKAEEALKESEVRYRALFEQSRDAIAIASRDGQLIDINQSFVDLFGYPKGELMKMKAAQLWASPDERSEWLAKMEAEGSVKDYEWATRRKDGEIRHCLLSSSRRQRKGGEVLYQTICRDVTEQKHAEDARRESELMFRLLSDQSLMAVAILQDGVYKYANEALSDLVEFSIEEITGWPPNHFLGFIHPDDRELVRQQAAMKQTGDPRQRPSYEFRVITRTGKTKWVEIYSKTVSFRGENANLVTMVDITERKRAEEQLRQSQKMEAVGTLAGGIAHDVNNLLQIILGHSDMLLLKSWRADQARKSVKAIRQAARNGGDLVKRILTFSRKAAVEMRSVDLSKEVLKVQGLLTRTIPKMIETEMLLPDDLWPTLADSSQLEQILINLAVNAKDAMPDGGRLVFETENIILDERYCSAIRDLEPGPYVLLTVSDSGHGIPKRVMEHMYDPFFTTKEPGQGTGLGLATVFGVMKAHGGHIACYSEVGVGTTFRMYFPAISEEEPWDLGTTEEMPEYGDETILIVDDDQMVRDLGREMLEWGGYKIITASDGLQAINIYREKGKEISLVILDLIMPVMGGKQCLKELLGMDPKTKVLIASGYSSNGPTKDALDSGAKGFLAKPFHSKELLTKVRKILDTD
jgi:PAS domain S-box-containing protein